MASLLRVAATLVIASALPLAPEAQAGNSAQFVYDNLIVRIAHNPNERLASFNADGKRVGLDGHFTSCELLLTAVAGRNGVYAAICTLARKSETSRVAVCDADMTNQFVVAANLTPKASRDELAEFMQNCVGG